MSQKIKDKIIYEENPWDDVKDFSADDFKVVEGLLPSPAEIKKAKIVVDGDELLLVRLSANDMKSLHNLAKNDGIPYPDLAASVLHQFVMNNASNNRL